MPKIEVSLEVRQLGDAGLEATDLRRRAVEPEIGLSVVRHGADEHGEPARGRLQRQHAPTVSKEPAPLIHHGVDRAGEALHLVRRDAADLPGDLVHR